MALARSLYLYGSSLTFVFLVLVLRRSSCVPPNLNVTDLSRAILSMTNDTLGVGRMKEYFASLSYQRSKKDISAEMVAGQISLVVNVQQRALDKIKLRVEQVYKNGDFTDREDGTQCCRVNNLTDSYEFGLPISVQQSCDRVSGIASPKAPSLYGELDSTFETNHKMPLKWQYFGSERGILNQYPSSRPSDCSSYDNRFRPWYKASATPNPKDVVIVIKNNPFPNASRLFEAADIILRTLNPRDRVGLVIYNEGIIKNLIGGCYATNLSLATPANVHLFQNFLKTAPDPRDGNRMSGALEAAYKYYDFDLDIPEEASMNSSDHPEEMHANITTRDRAIVFLTDSKRISSDERHLTKIVLQTYCYRLTMVSIFILHTTEVTLANEMLTFYQEIVMGVPGATIDNRMEISKGDLRQSITNFYSKFASQAQHSTEFKPVFIVPYYDVFGLEQLVMTLSTPCYNEQNELVGVASVDMKVSDMFASAEYFTQGDLSYAFVIDQEGLVLLHPLLPFPSTTSAAVYLDISTLEPQPRFEAIRQSMISGGSGSMELESHVVLSRSHSMQHSLEQSGLMCNYSWAPIGDAPYSLCVVVPVEAYDCDYAEGLFSPPINAHYHMLEVLSDEIQLCRQVAQYATPEFSTVVLFPEAFTQYSLQHGEELKTQSEELQLTLTSFNDMNSYLKTGVMEVVAATARAEEIWLELDGGNHGVRGSIHDYVAWRYIANSYGVMRIYPGTQVDIAGRRANQYPWYQSAVSDVRSVSISPPHNFGMGQTISLSKAIVKTCGSGSEIPMAERRLQCGIEAVMGVDIAHGHFWSLLTDTVEICRSQERYRCMLIDSNAYIITHPRFFSTLDSAASHHLSAIEPFLMRDMYRTGYVDRIYCNNFQYNSEFTKRPRKQFSYRVSNKVKHATEPLEGGYITHCIYYTIVPVAGTNAYFIVVDVKRSAHPLCIPVSCPCHPGQPCSNLPSDCTCPCVEELPPENYNSCLESFTKLSAHACTPETGFMFHSTSHLTMYANSSVEACYPQNCTKMATPLDCLSSVACQLTRTVLENGSLSWECSEMGHQLHTNLTSPSVDKRTTEDEVLLYLWQATSGILLLLLIVTLFCFSMYCMRDRGSVRRRRHGRSRVNTSSTNMVSVATDSSVENSLRRQSSQEHSCSSQEGLPAAVQKMNGNGTVSSYVVSSGSFFTPPPPAGDNPSVGKEVRVLISVGEEEGADKGGVVVVEDGVMEGRRGEGEGMCNDGLLRLPGDDPFDAERKMSSSFPDSLGTNGLHDMVSKLGESPDPSKAGGIWF